MERAVNHPDLQIDWLRALVAVVDAGSLSRSEEHTSELQSPCNLVCRLLLEKKNPHCPLPTGVSKSITRALTFSRTVSCFIRSCGYSGVKLSNRILLLASSGDSKLTASIFTSAKYFSPSCGGRTWPLTVSPVFRSNLRICEGET